VKETRRDPTVELMGPKNGKMIARNQIGMTTGSLAAALLHMLPHSCIPIAFSHTRYSGVHANPNVMNWWISISTTAASLNPVLGSRENAFEWFSSMSPNAQYTAAPDGSVRVSTYAVAARYIPLNCSGLHIACIISLHPPPSMTSYQFPLLNDGV